MNDKITIITLVILSPALLFIEPIVEGLLKRRKGRNLYRHIKKKGVSGVASLSWQQFERLCASYFNNKGYRVELFGQGGADGGRDLVLRRSGRKVLVQCKHWKSRVGVKVVREMYGVMTADSYDQVIIVGTSGFTKEAWSWSKGKPIILMDANILVS